MEKLKYQPEMDKYARRALLFKLILGWFNIALALYLSAFSIYSLVIGQTRQLPQIAAAIVACLPAGIVLVRSWATRNFRHLPNDMQRR
jgi:hypothetical protein